VWYGLTQVNLEKGPLNVHAGIGVGVCVCVCVCVWIRSDSECKRGIRRNMPISGKTN